MVVKDATLLLLYLGSKAQISSFWLKAAGAGGAGFVFLTVLAVTGMLVRALFMPRKLVSLSDKSQTVLGKPLLFPVKFNHMRLTPVKDKFRNRFLVAGIPVGLRCRIGGLLAVDDSSLDVSPPPGGGTGSSWNRILSHLSCWFSFDSARFLHRGDHGVDLREKLDAFLLSQNEDPAQWPHAYLLSVPQFLGWARNVVTWWHLYTENRELDAVILEINNSYWEKRNVFVRVNPTSDKPAKVSDASDPTNIQYLDNQQLVRSLSSTSQAGFYQGTWHKYIFASPFEKVDGVVSNRMMDPLQPCAWKPNVSFSNMTTMEETGEVRMATRLTLDGPPIDPTQMSAFDVAKFLFLWTVPGMLTTPEIIFKALKIRFTGSMKMNKKPPVRTGSVGRPMTKMEIDLESFFRAYLANCVEAYPEPVELTYLPCRGFTNDTIPMRSPSYTEKDPNARHLTVEPADPLFYARMINYSDAKTAVAEESKPTQHNADPTARRLIVSDPPLLTSILESASSEKAAPLSNCKLPGILSWSRWNSTPTFMDRFVLASPEPFARAVYLSSSLRLAFAGRFALGSQKLLGLYIFLTSCLLRWAILEGLAIWGPGRFTAFAGLDSTWTTAIEIVGYFAIVRLLTVTKAWLL